MSPIGHPTRLLSDAETDELHVLLAQPPEAPAASPEPPAPSFWGKLWAGVKKAALGTAAPFLAVVVVMGALVLIALGLGQKLQIGGILGRLFGKAPPEQKVVDVANSVDKDRVRPDGTVILPGQPDSKGNVQAVVVAINPPSLFSDPKTVTFTPPGGDTPVVVALPDGVTERDVDKVILVSPTITLVTVTDTSGIPAQRVEDLLKKYGGS